jgi:hypothetical protein
MACLSIKEAAVNAAKSVASAAKGTYDSSMGTLRAINPADYATRVDFETAKNVAINAGQSALSGYIDGVASVNGVASAISALSATKMDALAIATTLANTSIVGIIPGGPGVPGAVDAAKILEEQLQC